MGRQRRFLALLVRLAWYKMIDSNLPEVRRHQSRKVYKIMEILNAPPSERYLSFHEKGDVKCILLDYLLPFLDDLDIKFDKNRNNIDALPEALSAGKSQQATRRFISTPTNISTRHKFTDSFGESEDDDVPATKRLYPPCENCGRPSFVLCSNCKRVGYCGIYCQLRSKWNHLGKCAAKTD